MTPFHEILSRPPREAFPAFMQAWLGRPRGVSSDRQPLPRSLRRIHAADAGVPAELDCNHLLLPHETKREGEPVGLGVGDRRRLSRRRGPAGVEPRYAPGAAGGRDGRSSCRRR